MYKNYIAVAIRNLIKNKLYSAINIVGLAVGLAACLLIAIFVVDEFSYDSQWAEAEKIHRVHMTFNIPGRAPYITSKTSGPIKETFKTFFSDSIEYAARLTPVNTAITHSGKQFNEQVIWADAEVAKIFNFPVLEGNMQAALADNASIALSRSFARRHYGDASALGEIITVRFANVVRDFRVAAVYEDLGSKTSLSIPALVKIDEADFADMPGRFQEWGNVDNFLFIKLRNGSSISSIQTGLDAYSDATIDVPALLPGVTVEKSSDLITFSTQPLTDIHLNSIGFKSVTADMRPTGDLTTVIVFAALAALILLIACINFMNLATAKSTQRAREVVMRKVLGANRKQLVVQFLGESMLLALLALVLALVLVEILLPSYSAFVGKELVFSYADSQTASMLLSLVAVVGLVGGVYPALVLSGYMPARVLNSNKSAEGNASSALRNILVVLQFSISIALIVATSVVYGQKYYATNLEPGFNRENLLTVQNMMRGDAVGKAPALIAELQKIPGVSSITTGDTPANGVNSNRPVSVVSVENPQTIVLGRQQVGYDFFKTFQINLVAGRSYSIDYQTDGLPQTLATENGSLVGSIMINEGAVKRLGFASAEAALGQELAYRVGGSMHNPVLANLTVIGVVADIHFQSIREDVQPEMYVLDRAVNAMTVTMRYDGNAAAVSEKVAAAWSRVIPTVPLQYGFVSDAIEGEFEREESQSALLRIFAGLAIVIACLGLYGLAAFTAERRTKEIGIRKVMGATVADIVRLLIWQFSKPVLLANLIAWPLATYGMLRWLETFTYRIDAWLLIPICLVAGGAALAIAWATVGGNAAKVARTNPIKALRYE